MITQEHAVDTPELFRCDFGYPDDAPVIGIWLAAHDAPLPTDATAKLPWQYELVGTARDVKPVEGVEVFQFAHAAPIRVLPGHIEIRWVARSKNWPAWLRSCHYLRLIAQAGVERVAGVWPNCTSLERIVVHRLGPPEFDGLRTRSTMLNADGVAWSMFYTPAPRSFT